MSEPVEAEAEVPVEQMGLPSTITPQTLSRMEEIVGALSHEDAIKIFIYARDGITNSTLAIKKLELTQKKYYTRLKQLLDAGLLEKGPEGYRYTFLGNIVHQMGSSFKTIIEQGDRLELANKLRKTETLSLEEKQDLMKFIAPESEKFLDLSGMISPMTLIHDYEDLVKNLVDRIEQAEESIYIVTKYSDVRVMEAVIRSLQRGIEMKILTEEQSLTNRFAMLRAFISPRMMSSIIKFAKESSKFVRKTNVSYSFMIIDNKLAVIEIPHPTKEVFYLGFTFLNIEAIKKLNAFFMDMWEKAGQVSVI